MSTAVSPAPSPAAVAPDALRLVLFGLPAAGKTSLLGALSQAAQTQEHLLNGRLIDRSQALAELQQRVYEERSRPTAEEVVPYPVTFEPFAANARKQDAVLIDCDGRVANDLAARREELEAGTREGTLAHEVLAADTLILVIDAAATPAQVEADFVEFGRFLRLLEEGRGRRAEIGGLPVFLVLTKCDLLAKPTDTAADWMEHIEERKTQVHTAFKEFLAREEEDRPLPFGSVDLHLWATAVRRPPLNGVPARPREPYGVAELFRQGLEAAAVFRDRHRRAQRRLMWTVSGAGGLVVVLAALTVGLMFVRSHPLEGRIPPNEPNATVRLAGTPEELQARIRNLQDLEQDPQFPSIPPEEQERVRTLVRELRAYANFLSQVRLLSSPETAKDLEDPEGMLRNLTVPSEYQAAWADTEAVRDWKALRAALDRENLPSPPGWYAQLIVEGRDLERAPSTTNTEDWQRWNDRLTALVNRAKAPPFRANRLLPDAATATYAAVLRYPRVRQARTEWEEKVEAPLRRVRDLAVALGLTGERGRPLDVPRGLREFVRVDYQDRLGQLEKQYPDYRQKFTLAGLPDVSTVGLRKAAGERYENLIEAGRVEVLRQLRAAPGGNEETLARWRSLLPWLSDPLEFTEWRVLANLLARLHDPRAKDPVAALADFLRRDSFTLDPQQAVLTVPNDPARSIRPAGRLEVFHGAIKNARPAWVFVQEEKEVGDRTTRFTFRRGEGGALSYRPGDALLGQLAVKLNDENWTLTWAVGRSQLYQFQHLVREPLLHRTDPDYRLNPLDKDPEISLTWVPEGSIPFVPDLMPVVDLGPR